ncbi:MAG: hypothetical protein ACPHEP_08495 [Acidimicrobiales bacterium]
MLVDTSPKYSGEPTAEALANGLATLGRYGDNYMVHAAEGETVVPREVLDANPGLKEDLFRQMTMMGIEDPNRYVVGNELNSINPITGQPEFFFKKVFRAIKKVVKKIAPIAAPIIGNMIAPGIGGIIASGLVTKLQGGSWGDALKSAALSYAGSALSAGIGSALQGTAVGNAFGLGAAEAGSTFGSRFAEGLGRGLTSPFEAAGNLFSSGAQNPLAQGIFGPRGTGTFFSQSVDPASRFAQGDVGMFPSYKSGAELARTGIDPVTGRYNYVQDTTPSGFDPLGPGDTQNFRNVSSTTGSDLARAARPVTSGPMSDVGGRFQYEQYTLPGGQTVSQAELAQLQAGKGIQRLGIAPDTVPGAPTTGAKLPPGVRQEGNRLFFGDREITRSIPKGFEAVPQAKPAASFLGYTGPGAETLSKAAGQLLVPAALAGAAYFMTPEVETQAELMAQLDANNPRRVAYDEWQAIQDKNSPEALAKFEQWYGKPAYSASQLASSFGARPLAGITSLPIEVAGGGEVVGPGTGTSDSIPAMLSDGEFVMTAKAVRNAGNGDRDLGAARMYDMMNRFERGVA